MKRPTVLVRRGGSLFLSGGDEGRPKMHHGKGTPPVLSQQSFERPGETPESVMKGESSGGPGGRIVGLSFFSIWRQSLHNEDTHALVGGLEGAAENHHGRGM